MNAILFYAADAARALFEVAALTTLGLLILYCLSERFRQLVNEWFRNDPPEDKSNAVAS